MYEEIFLTHCAEETEAVGAMLAKKIEAEALPPFVALYGDLGVGKTAFVRGFASVFCQNAAVRSPTFALVNEYRGERTLFHFDMYRIEDEDDLYSIGFDDYLAREGIILTEWSENIPFALPDAYIEVIITKNNDEAPDDRAITVRSHYVDLGT